MTPAIHKVTFITKEEITEDRIQLLADIMHKPLSELMTPLEITESAELNILPSDQVYLFTWNPNDKRICPQDHNMKWDTMVLKYLKYLKRACRIFCVVPEISDMGRLHCHGWFVINDKIKWHKQVLHKFTRNGRFKMDIMRCTKALCYYVKDLEVTQGVLNYPVPYTHDTHSEWITHLQLKYLNKSKIKNIDINQYFDWD